MVLTYTNAATRVDEPSVGGRRPVLQRALRLIVGPDDGDGGRQVTP
jgi:hypothetical protein